MGSRVLHLNLKGEYFDQIAAGTKPFEFREWNEYWRNRLEGREYDVVLFKRGYPKRTDTEKIIFRKYIGYDVREITHDHFGPNPVKVAAIATTGGAP